MPCDGLWRQKALCRPRGGKPLNSLANVTPKEVLALAYPHSSTHYINMVCGLTRGYVWKILHAEGAHACHVTPQQALLPQDNECRFDWCN